VNVVPEMNDIINMTIFYVGGEACTTDKLTVLLLTAFFILTGRKNPAG